ncbi:Uncharacterised protein [uncultured archaeon]|nr:Uncharacterised protein [uncultured archaeon]
MPIAFLFLRFDTLFLRAIVIVVIIAMCVPLTSGNTYYIAMNGDDTNPGTESWPWLTIQKAANTMVAGETVYVMTGTYSEHVVTKKSGTSNNDIKFVVYPGETVTISGGGFYVDKNFITIDGFNFVNGGTAIDIIPRPPGGGNNITIRNNKMVSIFSDAPFRYGWYDKAYGDGHNLILENNDIEALPGSARIEAATLSGLDGFIVRDNTFANANGEGLNMKDNTKNGKVYNNTFKPSSQAVLYFDARGTVSNIDVYNNIIKAAAVLQNEDNDIRYNYTAVIDNISIYNNIFYGGNSSLRVGPFYIRGVNVAGTIKNVRIINNDFEGTYGVDVGGGLPKVENVIIRNNIFSNTGMSVLSGTVTIDHNIMFNTPCVGTNYIAQYPEFVNPAGGDFHLQSTSPAIDRGSPIGAPGMDFDWNLRPQGFGYDIGAFEFHNIMAVQNDTGNNNTIGKSGIEHAVIDYFHNIITKVMETVWAFFRRYI